MTEQPNILALDTSTEACSAALQIQGKTFSTIELCPQQHSQKILPMIDSLLEQANTTLASLDAIAFGCGPGSFTGLRIAASTAQGLAFGHQKPLLSVSSLETLAEAGRAQQSTAYSWVAMDARMQEIYMATYLWQQTGWKLQGQEQVVPPEKSQFTQQKNTTIALVGIGWQVYQDKLQTYDHKNTSVLLNHQSCLYPDALYMLPIATRQWQQQQQITVSEALPVYLRNNVAKKKQKQIKSS